MCVFFLFCGGGGGVHTAVLDTIVILRKGVGFDGSLLKEASSLPCLEANFNILLEQMDMNLISLLLHLHFLYFSFSRIVQKHHFIAKSVLHSLAFNTCFSKSTILGSQDSLDKIGEWSSIILFYAKLGTSFSVTFL